MLLSILILFSTLFFTTPAHAKLKLCNRSSHMLDAALAAKSKTGWQTRGWFRLYPGFCRIIIKKPLKQKKYYIHSRSAHEHTGAVKLFGGTKSLCIDPRQNRNFHIKNHTLCREKGIEKTGFALIQTSQRAHTHYFKEVPPFYNAKHAMVAGVQRLLRDNGFEISHVDGYWSKMIQHMIITFQRSIGIRPTGIITEGLFDRLLLGAQKQLGVQSGLKLCNKTPYFVWAAVGYRSVPPKSDYLEPYFESKGWVKIYPQTCAMLLREKLARTRYYIYAEAVDKSDTLIEQMSGKPLVWFGGFSMCLKRLQFKIKGRAKCVERGFQRAGFRSIETKGLPGWTEYLREGDKKT